MGQTGSKRKATPPGNGEYHDDYDDDPPKRDVVEGGGSRSAPRRVEWLTTSLAATERPVSVYDEARCRLFDEWMAQKRSAIARILDNDVEPFSAAPNTDSMSWYLSQKLKLGGESHKSLMGPYENFWESPTRSWWGLKEDVPEEILPAVANGEKPSAIMGEVMQGFSMKRPAFKHDSLDEWCFVLEPEFRRPNTTGLPRLTEPQIQCVENRIQWHRQRRCVIWARERIASGQQLVFMTTACKRAWYDWYKKDIRDLMTSTRPWKLISRSCHTVAARFTAFLCGTHPRAGNKSPVALLCPDVIRKIITFAPSCHLDDLEREPPPTAFENQFHSCFQRWLLQTTEQFHLNAFGNFDALLSQAGIARNALLSAYALLHENGPLIHLEDFVSAVEAGNVGNLQCYAFFKSGGYAHTPQERFMAIRLSETLFGALQGYEESKFRKCFTGDGIVSMGDGSYKKAKAVCAGDIVKTESGIKRVTRIEVKRVNGIIPMCEVYGVWLTPGHPVFVGGMWTHPFEISQVVQRYVSELFNFELSGGPLSPDHSVWINNLLVCTLGKDCGTRIVSGWPKADDEAGTGYWTSGTSQWAQLVSQSLSPPRIARH
ncbi:hypothetical protein Pelo_8821 [Pelomyxa schiedti]|nr:hypothetical protein Pelo_8821 [Pelomyxa schiedti]